MAKTWDAELYEARHSFVWELGQGVVELLDPKPGEKILDLGCGPGQLTYKIAEKGANVIGLDSSPEMIAQARQHYPQLQFVLQDAAAMQFEEEFDAVFSNAALHWMLDAEAVVKAIARALRYEGRFAAEFGGKGNIAHIMRAIETVLPPYYKDVVPPRRTYFPPVGEYAALLEARGLEVRAMQLFDRPTPLEGEHGMEDWIRQFKWFYFEGLPTSQQAKALNEVIEQLRPILFRDGRWYIDYRRLRLLAFKA